jgi:hypothetical protein
MNLAIWLFTISLLSYQYEKKESIYPQKNGAFEITAYYKHLDCLVTYEINKMHTTALVFRGTDTLKAEFQFHDNFGSCKVVLRKREAKEVTEVLNFKGRKKLFSYDKVAFFDHKRNDYYYRKIKTYRPVLIP